MQSRQQPSPPATSTNTPAIDAALRRLLAELEPELRALMVERRNWQMSINASAGGTYSVEVKKYIKIGSS